MKQLPKLTLKKLVIIILFLWVISFIEVVPYQLFTVGVSSYIQMFDGDRENGRLVILSIKQDACKQILEYHVIEDALMAHAYKVGIVSQ